MKSKTCFRARHVLMAVVCTLVGTAGCTESSVTEPGRASRVFTEHKFVVASHASRRVGEDCRSGGNSECLAVDGRASVCIRFSSVHEAEGVGYVCSVSCEDHAECPGRSGSGPAQDRWTCTSILPGPENSYCSPPKNFEPTAVQLPARRERMRGEQ